MKEVKGALFPAQLLLGEDFIVWPWQLGQETGPEKRGNSFASLVPEARGSLRFSTVPEEKSTSLKTSHLLMLLHLQSPQPSHRES